MESEQKVVLVIEDESSVRDSIVFYLEDYDFTVLQAENGAIGIEIFEQEKPDLILTDLRMPKLDGLEVLKYVRDHSPDTPLIVVSGTGNISDSIHAMRAGAWDYIVKPIRDMSVVSISIDRVMERLSLLKGDRAHKENLENLVFERTSALQKANAQLSNINGRLRKIIGSTGELAKCSDVSKFGSTLLNEFAGHMKATGGSLFFIEEDGLRLLDTKEPSRIPDFIPFPLADGSIMKRVLDSKQPLLIENIDQESTLTSSGWKKYNDNSVLAFPLPDESGRIVGVLTLHNKIYPPFVEQDKEIGSILASFSRETLRAVQNSETIRINAELQQTILDSLYTGIIVIDPENHMIVDANSEVSRLVGIPKEQIIGKTCHQFICPAEEGKCPLTNIQLPVDNSERVLLTADRTEIPILKTAATIQLNGRKHYLESFVDISKSKEMEQEKTKLEAQLFQAQKMEAIGTLAADWPTI